MGDYGAEPDFHSGTNPRLVLTRLHYEEDELDYRISKQIELLTASEQRLRSFDKETHEVKLPLGWLIGAAFATLAAGLSTVGCGVFGCGFMGIVALILWGRFLSELRYRKKQLGRQEQCRSAYQKEVDTAREYLEFMREQLTEIRRRIANLEKSDHASP